MTEQRNHSRLAAWLAGLLAAAALSLPGVFLHDFWIYNEGRRALIALEMFQRHSFLVPRLLGAPILTKPPLFYWLEALCYGVFGGPSDWAARIPSLVAGGAGVAALVLLLTPLLGLESALFGGLVLALMPIYFWMAQSAEPEMLFVVLGVLAVLCLVKIAFEEKRGAGWRAGLYLFAGLAFLTKGPIVPLVVLLLALAAPPVLRKRDPAVPRFSVLPGVAILLAPIAAWVLLLRTEGYGLRLFIENMSEHAGLGEGNAPYSKSFTYFFHELRRLAFPWWYLTLAALAIGLSVAWRQRGAKGVRGALGRIRDYCIAERGERFLLLAWFVFTLAALSAIPSKRYYYGLALAPPLAGLCAMIYRDWVRFGARATAALFQRHPRWSLFFPAFVAAGLLAAGLELRFPEVPAAYAGDHMLDAKALCLWAALWLGGIVAAAAVLSKRRERSDDRAIPRACAGWTLATVLALASIYNLFVHPRIDERLSLKKAAREIAGRIPAGASVFSVGGNHTIWFYLARPDVPVVEENNVDAYAAAHPGSLGVVYRKHLDVLGDPGRYTILYQSDYIPVRKCQVFLVRLKIPAPSRHVPVDLRAGKSYKTGSP